MGSGSPVPISSELRCKSCCSWVQVICDPCGTIRSNLAHLRRVRVRGNGWNGGGRVERIRVGRRSKNPKLVGIVRAGLYDTRPEGRPSIAVLMEVEGVIADVHRHGNRQGFNLAFQELGLECPPWTETVFADLTRRCGGVEEKMLSSFFKLFPATLPPDLEKGAFIREVLKAKSSALEKLAASKSVPLRPGLERFVDEVLAAGVPLVILAAYYKGGEGVGRVLADKLGEERSRQLRFVGESDVETSSYGQLVLGEGVSLSLDEQLAAAASKGVAAEKQKIAQEVASLLRLSVEIDTGANKVSKETIAALRAGAEMADVDVDQCILLASGLAGSQAAYQIGMPCVVVRSSLTARAEFPAAKACLDGYGPGSTTLPRLLKFL